MIVVCEPQCEGFEHVEVNSAFIATLKYAFPEEKILFLAEEKHLKLVVSNIRDLENIEYIAVSIPERFSSSICRQYSEYRLCSEVFQIATQQKSNRVLFCSITSPGLIAVKILTRVFGNINVSIVLHSILETVIRRPSLKPWETLFWFRPWFLFGNTEKMRYIVFGSSIKEQLSNKFPGITNRITSINLPYVFADAEEHVQHSKPIIEFGSFGVGHRGKGTQLLFKMAYEISNLDTQYKAKFTLIGHITDQSLKSYSSESVNIPSPDKPLSRSEYEHYAKQINYAIFLYKPTSYRLTASGALFDAFSYGKPIIAVRNPFFEYYFKIMGDIGYLCDSYSEMKNIIIDILNSNKDDHYEYQRRNILEGRKQLTLENIAKDIVGIWG